MSERDRQRTERPEAARGRALGDELVRIHDHLRQEMATLLNDVEDYLAGTSSTISRRPRALAAQLHERCLSVCVDIDGHHRNENDRGLPLLERNFPELGPALEQVRREHDMLAVLRRQVEATIAELGLGDAEMVRTTLRRLASEMAAHFDREEELLVPALNAL